MSDNLQALETELQGLEKEGLKIQTEIKDNEQLLEGKKRALKDIERMDGRVNAMRLTNSRLRDALKIAKDKITAIEETLEGKDTDKMQDELNKLYVASDKLKEDIDNANGKYSELQSKNTLARGIAEKIERQRKENDKFKSQLDVTLSRIKEA